MLIKSELNARARLQYCRIPRNGVGRGCGMLGTAPLSSRRPEGLDTGIQWRMANGEWGCGDRAPLSSPAGAPDLIRGAAKGSSGECRIGSGERGRGLREVHCLRRHARPRAGHRRLSAASTGGKTGMAGTGPAMTWRGRPTRPPPQSSSHSHAPTPHSPLPTRHSPMDPVPRLRLAGDDGGGFPLPTFHAPLPIRHRSLSRLRRCAQGTPDPAG